MISPRIWRCTLTLAAPLARRSPISRVRCVTFCQRTPSTPNATISMRKPATRPTAASGANAKRLNESRIAASVVTSKDQPGAAASSRFISRSSKAAVVPGRTLISKVRGGRSR